MIWQVPKTWRGETAVILAGGPSLRGFDAGVLEPKKVEVTTHGDAESKFLEIRKRPRVITINDSWHLAPRADVFYFCDKGWWQTQMDMNQRSVDGSLSFHESIYKGFWVCGNGLWYADHPQVRGLRFNGQSGLSDDPAALRHGSNSGYAAINLAALFGAKRIILLGYDMKVQSNGRTHWHDQPRPDGFASIIKDSFLPCLESLVEPLKAAGVEVLNATPGSALACWPMVTLEEALSVNAEKETICRK